MPKRAVSPPEFRAAAEQLRMSPAILSNGFAFLTGVTGGDAQGRMPDDAEAQFRNVFRKIGLVRWAGFRLGRRDDELSCRPA